MRIIGVCFAIIFSVMAAQSSVTAEYIHACNNSVFCQGEVLRKVQMAHIFKDSKTFVDMPLKVQYTEDIEKEIMRNQSKEELKATIEKYFDKPGQELEPTNISEPIHEPLLFKNLKSDEYRNWAKHLCLVWKKLVRKMKRDVETNAERYSLIYMEKSFVVPGGRFREMYYWDTYWSIEGLLICGMYERSKNILHNLLHLVEEVGFVPNGGRKYYKNRSQPPFLTLMVAMYWSHTKDDEFIKNNINTLTKEYDFWMKQRSINVTSTHSGKSYNLNRYNSMLGYPRPESYKEDVELMIKAGHEHNKTRQMEMYSHIASAAESGWDFSSRLV